MKLKKGLLKKIEKFEKDTEGIFKSKVWRRMRNSFVLILIIISVSFFYIGYHNTDLMSNYALLYNSVNKEYNCQIDRFWDLYDVHDCNGLMQCHDYATIYTQSMLMQMGSFIIMTMIAMAYIIDKLSDK